MTGAVFGFALLIVFVTAGIAWIGTRRILLSPYPGTPILATLEGWRGLLALIGASPRFALVGAGVKLLQIMSYSARTLTLGHSPEAWVAVGVPIDLLFTLAWAGVGLKINLSVLAPDATAADARARLRRAVLYAFIFWGVMVAFNFAGILWYAVLGSNGRIIVGTLLTYLPYVLIVLSALTRPAIAVAVPRPFMECIRILRENWFGVGVTLGIAALPLGLVYFGVGLARQAAHLSVVWALLLEVPIAVLSALCYAAFEAAIAATYRWIM